MKSLIIAFMAGFLSFGCLCWIACTFYAFFKQQFHRQEMKNNEIIKNAISSLDVKLHDALKQGIAEIELKHSSLVQKALVQIERTNSMIFKTHIEQMEIKVNTLLKTSIDGVEDLSDKMCRKLSKVYERETEDHESKKHEILDPMTEEKTEYEVKLALYRRFKERYYREFALKDLRRRVKEGVYTLNDVRRLFPDQIFLDTDFNRDFSEEDEAKLAFYYDQWIRLEQVLFSKK